MKTQTAVEWLVQTLELDTRFNGVLNSDIEKAKQMEKQQIVESFDEAIASYKYGDGEKYYNQTYGGNE